MQRIELVERIVSVRIQARNNPREDVFSRRPLYWVPSLWELISQYLTMFNFCIHEVILKEWLQMSERMRMHMYVYVRHADLPSEQIWSSKNSCNICQNFSCRTPSTCTCHCLVRMLVPPPMSKSIQLFWFRTGNGNVKRRNKLCLLADNWTKF